MRAEIPSSQFEADSEDLERTDILGGLIHEYRLVA
jgi:hypothetical protein